MTDVAEFLARHAKPYDAATDTYRRPPFAAPIRAGKNTAIYHAHSYHTKVPPQGILPYIEHYTSPGAVVMDPFCGSGMTGVACLMAGRHALLNDLSPAATHIARNYCASIDSNRLMQEYDRIMAAVAGEFAWLYRTRCDRCGGEATIQYAIWSDVFECTRCGTEIVLWDVAVDPDSGRVQSKIVCPTCHALWRKSQLRLLHSKPVVTNYGCDTCSPSRAEHRTTPAEESLISQVEGMDIPYWCPSAPVDPTSEMAIRCSLPQRGITQVGEFYTKRNLWALARLWQEILHTRDAAIRERLRFVFTASLQNASRMYKYRADRKGGILSGTLFIPSLSCELNVGRVFARKATDSVFELPSRGTAVLCMTGSATTLRGVPDNTADYVFTDPPFGMNIYYSDLNIIWEAWLGRYTNPSEEAVVNRERKVEAKTLRDYAMLMAASFQEMSRVLKPGRWASVVFHNSDDAIWQAILDATEAAGLELAEINSFDKEQLSFKGVRGAKGLERVTNKDIVLNLLKPRSRPTGGGADGSEGATRQARSNGDSEIRIIERIAQYLAGNPSPEGRTLQALWNTALGEMIRSGIVEASMEDVGQMLPHYFKDVDGHWYLRGEAVLGGNVFDVTTDAGAIAWLTALLTKPATTGELIPEWQKITAQAGGAAPGRLERLLEDSFWLDQRSGRWRVPTQAQRDRMSAQESIRDQAHLRVVRRFLAGQLPQQPNPREIAAWVQFCYHHEAYAEAVKLFALLDPTSIDEEWYSRLRRIVAVCSARAGDMGPEGQ